MIFTYLGRIPRAVMSATLTGSADPPVRETRSAAGVLADVGLAVLLFYFTFDMLLSAEGTGSLLTQFMQMRIPGQVKMMADEQAHDGLLALAAAGATSGLLLRSRAPLFAWRYATVATAATAPIVNLIPDQGGLTTGAIISYALILYTVGVRCDGVTAAGAGIVSVAAIFVTQTFAELDHNTAYAGPVLIGGMLLLGHSIRNRRRAKELLAAEQKRSGAELGARMLLEERSRIARELHDIVAHHVVLIAIQAEAVPLQAKGDEKRLEAGLATIRKLSLETIHEMRQVLGVLRQPGAGPETAPQPGLDRLGELADAARGAGLTVDLTVEGPVDALPGAFGLSAYRIVQEALSNAMRHAPGSKVAISLALLPGELQLSVANGPARGPAPLREPRRSSGQRSSPPTSCSWTCACPASTA